MYSMIVIQFSYVCIKYTYTSFSGLYVSGIWWIFNIHFVSVSLEISIIMLGYNNMMLKYDVNMETTI